MRCVLILLLFSGCVTERKCLERFPPKETLRETVKEYYRDSLIPGAIVTDSVYLPGKEVITNHWYAKMDTAGKAELRWMIDQYGNIIAQCHAKDITIQNLTREINKEKTTVVEEGGLVWWQYVLIGAGNLLTGIVVGVFIRKR